MVSRIQLANLLALYCACSYDPAGCIPALRLNERRLGQRRLQLTAQQLLQDQILPNTLLVRAKQVEPRFVQRLPARLGRHKKLLVLLNEPLI